MKAQQIVLFFTLISLAPSAAGQSSARFSIRRSVVAGGGATFTANDRFQLGSTIAQPLAAVPGSARFSIQSGFWYQPALEIVAASQVGTNLVFSFETEPGKAYAVQSANSLANPSWETFATFTGNGIAKTVMQSAVGVTHRFYRVIQE
jgi:hypothetical protein